MKHKGSCHCGRVAFEVEGDVDSAIDCNCSICSRKGSLLWFVPRDKLRLLTPEADASTYLFNKHVIKHRFCVNCGIHPFGRASIPRAIPWPLSTSAAWRISIFPRCRSSSSTAGLCRRRAADH